MSSRVPNPSAPYDNGGVMRLFFRRDKYVWHAVLCLSLKVLRAATISPEKGKAAFEMRQNK
jgi:hypothetical protein